MRIWTWLLAFGVGVGCTLDGYTCIEDGDCVQDRSIGVCQPQGACSFPDISCPSGQRFGDAGPIDVAGVCVPPTAAKGAAPLTDDPDADEPSDDGPSAGGNTGGEPSEDDDPKLPDAAHLLLHVPMHTGVERPLDDVSGNGFVLSCDGSCPVATANGATFGSGRNLRVPYDPRLDATSFTMTVWVKPSTADSVAGSPTLVYRLDAFAMYLTDFYGEGDNDFCAGMGTTTAWCEEDVIDTTDWYHLAMRWDGTFLEMYVDGEMVHRELLPAMALPATDLSIGRSGTGALDDFDGTLGDLRLYDIALDDDELAAVIDAA